MRISLLHNAPPVRTLSDTLSLWGLYVPRLARLVKLRARRFHLNFKLHLAEGFNRYRFPIGAATGSPAPVYLSRHSISMGSTSKLVEGLVEDPSS
jgi:hypothetical protein